MSRYSKKESFLSRLSGWMPWSKRGPFNGYASPRLNTVFAWVFIIFCSLWIQIWIDEQALLGVVMLWGLYILGMIYLCRSRVRLPARSLALFILALLFSLALITNANHSILNWLVFLLFLAFFVWIYDFAILGGRRLNDESLVAHLFSGVFKRSGVSVKIFFSSLFAGSTAGTRGKRILRTIGLICIGLLIAIIPTLMIAALLSYDSQFSDLLDKIFAFDSVFEDFGDLIRDLILGWPFAMLFFAALFDAQQKNAMQKTDKAPDFSGVRFAPRVLLCAAVTPVLLIYVIFFISQWQYYVSAFTHVLPGDLTYAEYAREGFFQLCTVCGINVAILLAFRLFMKRDNVKSNDWLTRVYTILISLFSLILIATALSKMILYIDSYGLTQKRVYASWFIILLAFVFIVVLIRQFITRMQIAGAFVIGFICMFGLIALPNVDAMIADYNVNAYLRGDLDEVDVLTLRELGVSAIPAAVDLENLLKEKALRTEYEEELLEDLGAHFLDSYTARYQQVEQEIFSFNIPEARARKLLADRPMTNPDNN